MRQTGLKSLLDDFIIALLQFAFSRSHAGFPDRHAKLLHPTAAKGEQSQQWTLERTAFDQISQTIWFKNDFVVHGAYNTSTVKPA